MAVIVRLPFCARPVALPVLAKPVIKGTNPASRLWLARRMTQMLADALPGLPPARVPGQKGRPRLRGSRLPSLAGIAAATTFTQVTVTRYGQAEAIRAAAVTGLRVLRLRHPPRPGRAPAGQVLLRL